MKYGNEIRKQRLPVAKAPIDEYRENPRNYSGGSLGILERYREMIGDLMEDEITGEEIVRIYEALLTDLTLNSKPMITDLTIIAGEQRAFGEGIADAICCRIVEVPVDKKLPSLYLLDSIVKNIGCEYIDYFSARLPEVFLEAYRQVDRRQHPALRHLFGTWSKVFPDSVLLKIDVELQHMSDSPQLSHGIHVNPKYVEDKQRARVASSPLRSYGQLTLPRDEYDIDRSDVLKSRTSPNIGSNRWFTDRDDLRVEPDYKRSRATEREDRGTNDWWRKHSADRTYLKLDSSSAHNQVNDPRALIDAYGSDRGRDYKPNWQDTPKALIDAYGTDRLADRLTVGHLKGKSFSDQKTAGSWMNTEEEEYDWEDINPTLVDGVRSGNLFPTSLPSLSGSLRTRYEPVMLGGTPDSEFRSDLSKSVPDYLARGPHQERWVHPGLQSSQSLISGNDRGRANISLQASNNNSFSEDHSESGARSYQPPIAALRGRPAIFYLNNGDSTRAGPREWATSRPKQSGEFIKSNGGDAVVNQGSGYSKFDSTLHNVLPSASHYPNQLPGYLSNKQTNQMQDATLSQQFLTSQERHGIHQKSNHLGAWPSHHGYAPQGNISSASNTMPNLTGSSYLTNNLPSGQVFMGGAPLSASVARPALPSILQSSGFLQNTANTASGGGGTFSGLFSSLMSQGLISLTNQQDSVGVDFNPEILKLRHDLAIKTLYTDLPRQCTTCGLRFKDQELHRNHMDWHVTKNRMSKNRKQKASRKWFASASMWLSGTEASGPEAIPGFLPTETVVENQDEEEMAVPADEDQTTCELCGEPFDDFYCHETDEWMYRGAVYLNMSPGSTAGLDRSQLGPIVHAKCRPG